MAVFFAALTVIIELINVGVILICFVNNLLFLNIQARDCKIVISGVLNSKNESDITI